MAKIVASHAMRNNRLIFMVAHATELLIARLLIQVISRDDSICVDKLVVVGLH